jgi:hypothetical protein
MQIVFAATSRDSSILTWMQPPTLWPRVRAAARNLINGHPCGQPGSRYVPDYRRKGSRGDARYPGPSESPPESWPWFPAHDLSSGLGPAPAQEGDAESEALADQSIEPHLVALTATYRNAAPIEWNGNRPNAAHS